MRIDSPSENKIIVELSGSDMRELDITYEEMDYSSIETRRVIWTVLDAAGKYLGRDLDLSRKMSIEAYPSPSGGCTLSFTMLGRKPAHGTPVMIKPDTSLTIGFDSASALMDSVKGLTPGEASGESSLYELNGKYRLIITSPEHIRSFAARFSEYRCNIFRDRGTRLLTEEHWNRITSGNALELICSQTQKRQGS